MTSTLRIPLGVIKKALNVVVGEKEVHAHLEAAVEEELADHISQTMKIKVRFFNYYCLSLYRLHTFVVIEVLGSTEEDQEHNQEESRERGGTRRQRPAKTAVVRFRRLSQN